MSQIQDFTHNGAEVRSERSPAPYGPLGKTVLGVVGTAPDADASIPKNKPYRVSSTRLAALLDTKGNERGTAVDFCNQVLKVTQVPIYVVIVDEGVDEAATINNIIGGTDADGQRTGTHALTECTEKPTHIFAPGYSSNQPVADELVAIGKRMYAIPVGDAPNTTDQAAITYCNGLPAVGTGYEAFYLVDNWPHVYSKAESSNVIIPASTMAATCFGRVLPWESPASNGGVVIAALSRQVDYDILDQSSQADLLMKNGVSVFVDTSEGYKLKGNRCIHGDFVNKKGLEYAIIRKLAATSESDMGKNLTERFMNQKVKSVNSMLKAMIVEEALMGCQVFLHPTLNSTEKYKSGCWAIAIEYAGYSPNEHMIYVLDEDDGIVDEFIGSIL
ncbi:phage tail protein [Vibrio sp. S4M6]|uniref:phage tail protein n=1 Tax=Vibrio sinus TaxID=2946865 RepID=UPI00202A8CE2|nr:phage tail protein [Vibrio sinus]MCL9783670.1 phage tail protein [Vibrio sinus]